MLTHTERNNCMFEIKLVYNICPESNNDSENTDQHNNELFAFMFAVNDTANAKKLIKSTMPAVKNSIERLSIATVRVQFGTSVNRDKFESYTSIMKHVTIDSISRVTDQIKEWLDLPNDEKYRTENQNTIDV